MQNLIIECTNYSIPFTRNHPLAECTSFKTGGPADLLVAPKNIEQIKTITGTCRKTGIPLFVIGCGANILVSDKGIRGCVLTLEHCTDIYKENNCITAYAGAPLSEVVEKTTEWELAGLQDFYSMPGSVGGSVWMNARCYGISVSEVLYSVTCLDETGSVITEKTDRSKFGYKKTPFQQTDNIILSATFELAPGDRETLSKIMEDRYQDRKSKGHFDFPSAGSVFKNNREFGEPTGKIIDSLGLRGYSVGGARISPKHANIIINSGNATATDILHLIEFIKKTVKQKTGFLLEEEVITVGEP